jgi:hypothetical protein
VTSPKDRIRATRIVDTLDAVLEAHPELAPYDPATCPHKPDTDVSRYHLAQTHCLDCGTPHDQTKPETPVSVDEPHDCPRDCHPLRAHDGVSGACSDDCQKPLEHAGPCGPAAVRL